jgi:hypothetical protein
MIEVPCGTSDAPGPPGLAARVMVLIASGKPVLTGES